MMEAKFFHYCLTGNTMVDLDPSLSVILNLYDKLPFGCKPRDDEYSVLAGIVAKVHGGDPTVIALATGTKCIGRDFNNTNGCLLSDSHAEVIVRRAFICYLYNQIHRVLNSIEKCTNLDNCCISINEHTSCNNKQPIFTISEGWEFTLYVSDSPCGDAAMYEATLAGEAKIVTGAKICSENCEAPGCLRTKSGRSDISLETRTTSMSCSDKISRWSCLGLQGSLLTAWLSPVYLSSVLIDSDPLAVAGAQSKSAQRALVQRLQQPQLESNTDSNTLTLNETETTVPRNLHIHLPSVQVLNSELFYSHGKAVSKQRFPALVTASSITSTEEPARKKVKKNPLSPCGFSLNWYLGVDHIGPVRNDDNLGDADAIKPKVKPEKSLPAIGGGTLEVTIAHTGALQGSTKKSVGEAHAASRLSRYHMRRRFESLLHRCVYSCSSNSSGSRGECVLAQRMCEALVQALPVASSAAVLDTTEGTRVRTGCAEAGTGTDTAGSTGTSTIPVLSPTVEHSSNRTERQSQDLNRISSNNASSCPHLLEVDSSKSLLLQYVQSASLQELKVLCGKREYTEQKEGFLALPVFRDWLCDGI